MKADEPERKRERAALRNAIHLLSNGLPRSIWLTCGIKNADAVWIKAQMIVTKKYFSGGSREND